VTSVQHHANLRQLAQRQDQVGAFARGRLKLILVGDALCAGLGQEAAAEWWRQAADTLDQLDDQLRALLPDVAAVLPLLGDRLRGVAAVIEEADIG
jgi:hypothetical protein